MKENSFMRVLFCKIPHCPFICFCKPPPSATHLYTTSGPLKLEHVVPSTVIAVSDNNNNNNGNEEGGNVLKSCIRIRKGEIGKKKVQWLDDVGKQLAEIKEFESSETGDTDSEEENSRCLCVIL